MENKYKWIENLISGDLIQVEIIGVDGSIIAMDSLARVHGKDPWLKMIVVFSEETGFFHRIPYSHVKPVTHG